MSVAANSKPLNLAKTHPVTESIRTEVLIIGAGLAGLSTALALPKSLNITVLSKAALETCSSHYAQGGIAASLAAEDSVNDHIKDTLIAGAGLCASDNTASILRSGKQAVQWLCEQGVPFTQVANPSDNDHIDVDVNVNANNSAASYLQPNLTTDNLHLTQEGGHGCRRVAHADDATGRHIMEALTAQAHAASNISILPFHEALQLLTDKGSKGGNRCQGAIVFDHNHQRQRTIESQAVVMASGGLGQLFARASAPNVCVGDGVMMAWQAGGRLANLEFVQFHPTGLALGESSFLISEALRGEGGRLYCPITGQRFMLAVDERAELAPRDIVARAIAEQIANNGLGYVHLDVSHLPTSFLRAHFPQIYQTLLALGIDITTDPIPVAPTAHYSCGGIVTCDQGLSDVPGLYAAGEVAYTGLHGANRLASNSLLECIVVGHKIAKHLPRYLTDHIWSTPTVDNLQPILLSEDITFHQSTDTDIDIDANSDIDTDAIAASLKTLMTTHMGIVRHAKSLERALWQLQQWQQLLKAFSINDISHLQSRGNLSACLEDIAITSETLLHFKLARQLQLATLIVQSALQRHESRGGHYRQDYPTLATKPLVSVISPCISERPLRIGITNKIKNIELFEENLTYSEPLLALAPI
ncbi:L-aspartate oxidase [Psychrobacter sp. Ps3]|uniref:L-aspartate oxidase n=1 Tax=Psychrobacter sp. Ps3 TaxID=2790957 RepID=UPI001EE0E323|nr:L-aspartate oxidase [Psychrobacter sp. Ps3]MCG3881863.1 L-aspartate oxidase [Psychrobacter sp. Ps3]